MSPKTALGEDYSSYMEENEPLEETTKVPTTVRDMYAQVHPIETPELIATGLAKLQKELNLLPAKDTAVFHRATIESPELVDDAHRLMFLRCELFNADLAARRLAKYWTKRLEFFGEKKAFKSLTLENIYDDDEDEVALRRGFLAIIPMKHKTGRRILYCDPGKLDKTLYTREMLVRSVWYFMHRVLSDTDVQKKGVIGLVNPRTAKFSEVEKKIMWMCTVSVKGCIPIRLSAFHVCHTPMIFKVIFPFVKVLIGPRLRKRLRLHFGSDQAVIKVLSKFHITKDQIPDDLGGNFVYDHDAWIEDMRAQGL